MIGVWRLDWMALGKGSWGGVVVDVIGVAAGLLDLGWGEELRWPLLFMLDVACNDGSQVNAQRIMVQGSTVYKAHGVEAGAEWLSGG